MKKFFLLFALAAALFAEDGSRLWLRYDKVSDAGLLKTYSQLIKACFIEGKSETFSAIKEELKNGLSGLLEKKAEFKNSFADDGILFAGVSSSEMLKELNLESKLSQISDEGFLIFSAKIKNKTDFTLKRVRLFGK